jgi:hypothetical protein
VELKAAAEEEEPEAEVGCVAERRVLGFALALPSEAVNTGNDERVPFSTSPSAEGTARPPPPLAPLALLSLERGDSACSACARLNSLSNISLARASTTRAASICCRRSASRAASTLERWEGEDTTASAATRDAAGSALLLVVAIEIEVEVVVVVVEVEMVLGTDRDASFEGERGERLKAEGDLA